MRRRRQSVAVLASAALLGTSLTAAADCASLCASAAPVTLDLNSAATPCGHCIPQHLPAPQQKNPNCGTHCLSQAIAKRVSITAPQTSLHATYDFLSVNKRQGLELVVSEPEPTNSESHSPPTQSGRSICRHTSLLRI